MVDDTIYVSTPDNAWALDARDGREVWHFFWKTRGGTHIASRGLGMWNGYLYLETPDNYLVSLDARTGKERWHKVIADFSLQYFSTTAPVVVGNHVIAGTGNDIDAPGFLQSFDPETGELQWKLYTVPMNPGDPGLGQQILSHRFQNPPRSILMSITKLNTTRIVIFLDSAVKNFQHPPNIIGVNKLEGAFPHQLEGLISEHALY